MKKLLLLIAIVGVSSFASCFKDYSCKCTTVTSEDKITVITSVNPDDSTVIILGTVVESIQTDSTTSTSGKIGRKSKAAAYCADMELSATGVKANTDSTTTVYTCESAVIEK